MRFPFEIPQAAQICFQTSTPRPQKSQELRFGPISSSYFINSQLLISSNKTKILKRTREGGGLFWSNPMKSGPWSETVSCCGCTTHSSPPLPTSSGFWVRPPRSCPPFLACFQISFPPEAIQTVPWKQEFCSAAEGDWDRLWANATLSKHICTDPVSTLHSYPWSCLNAMLPVWAHLGQGSYERCIRP